MMAAAANTAPGAGFSKAFALPRSLSNLDSESVGRMGAAAMPITGNPAPGAEFSPSSEIPKMRDGGSLATVLSEQPRGSLVDSASASCAASCEASQCAVTSKKGVIGIGVPKHLHDESRGLYFAESAAFSSVAPVYGGSDGGAQAPPVLAGGARYANPSELPPSIGVGGVGFSKPHHLEASHG